jgi:hypothetical protein
VNELPLAAQEPVDGISQVPGYLLHPRVVRLVKDTRDLDAPTLEVDHEQHEVAHEPAQREDFDAEEIGGSDSAPMRTQERAPARVFATFGRGLDAVISEDALDRAAPDEHLEHAERAADARVTPARSAVGFIACACIVPRRCVPKYPAARCLSPTTSARRRWESRYNHTAEF